MITKEIAIELSINFIHDLKKLGYSPKEAYMYGSYAKETSTVYSDIDLAVWDDKFTGCLSIDWKDFKYLIMHNTYMHVHTYNGKENEEADPFLKVVKQRGIKIL